MKKIGFIDYYISEWHANNYPEWIKRASEELGCEIELAYAYAECEISAVDGVTTDEWCEKFGAEKCESIAELCEKSDCIVILAPSNPEKHLVYAKEALKHGKPAYIDKPFALTVSEAAEIFALSKKYDTPIFTCSALRYAEELSGLAGSKSVIIEGSGSSIDEYIIHQAEMVECVLGEGACAIECRDAPKGCRFYISYPDGREAQMLFAEGADFSVTVNNVTRVVASDFFYNMIKDILSFFSDSVPRVSEASSMEIVRIVEGAIKAAAARETKISL